MQNALVPVKSDYKHDELIQLVSFNLDQEEYGVDVLKVREIIRMPIVTRVPNTPHYVEGVINLRGKVVPIISMRKKFGLKTGAKLIIYEKDNEIVISTDAKAFVHQFVGILKGSKSGDFLMEQRKKDRELEDKKLQRLMT